MIVWQYNCRSLVWRWEFLTSNSGVLQVGNRLGRKEYDDICYIFPINLAVETALRGSQGACSAFRCDALLRASLSCRGSPAMLTALVALCEQGWRSRSRDTAVLWLSGGNSPQPVTLTLMPRLFL